MIAALVGTILVAAPAAADADAISLDCSWSGGPYTGYWYEAQVTEAGAPFSGSATVEINADPEGANTWVASPAAVVDGLLEGQASDFFSGEDYAEVGIRVSAGAATQTCWAVYEPVIVDYSGSLHINGGDTAAVLADGLLSDAVADEAIRAYLFVKSGSTWVDVANARLTDFGHYAVLSYRPSYSREAYIAVYSELDDRYLGSTEVFTIDVKRSVPTVVSKPTSVVQGSAAKITAAYGSSETKGRAYLQAYTGSAWKTISSVSFSNGVASFSRTQSATTKYRVAFTPTGKSTVYTAAFTITYLPLFTLKAPKSAKKRGWIDIDVTNRWTKNGTIKLQYYSGGTWRTYRSYWSYAKTSMDLTVQINGTYKWRILAGTYASPSVTVVAK